MRVEATTGFWNMCYCSGPLCIEVTRFWRIRKLLEVPQVIAVAKIVLRMYTEFWLELSGRNNGEIGPFRHLHGIFFLYGLFWEKAEAFSRVEKVDGGVKVKNLESLVTIKSEHSIHRDGASLPRFIMFMPFFWMWITAMALKKRTGGQLDSSGAVLARGWKQQRNLEKTTVFFSELIAVSSRVEKRSESWRRVVTVAAHTAPLHIANQIGIYGMHLLALVVGDCICPARVVWKRSLWRTFCSDCRSSRRAELAAVRGYSESNC